MAYHGRQQKGPAHGNMKQDNENTAGIAFTAGHMIYFGSSANKRNIIHGIYYKSNIRMWKGYGKTKQYNDMDIQPYNWRKMLVAYEHVFGL